MKPEQEILRDQPYFYDGFDSVIQDEPYEPTGEMIYRQRTKSLKKAEKKSNAKKSGAFGG